MPIVLRDYQHALKADIFAAWNAGYKNILAVKPTGMGKTKTFCSIAKDMAIEVSGPKFPTAIMVHRKELVSQISLTLAEEGIQHNIIAPKNVILGIIAAQRQLLNRQYYDYNAPITVISVDTLNARIVQHEKWAKSIRFWITDEAAHVLKKNKWGKAINYFPNAVGLGVTATPERLDRRGLGSHADGVFDTMVLGPSTRWGIDQGYLCKYKVAVPVSDYKGYLKKASEGSDYTREAMALASLKSSIVGDVVKNYLKFAKGKQAIVFSSDIIAAKKTEEEFKKNGITAKLLTGETPDAERLKALISYREKKIQILLNVDLFDEGLDVPGIECVVMARPTMSLGKYLQMIGRGLRPMKNKPYCIIIDHVGNVQTHGLPCQPRKWTLDRIIKRGERINLLRICQNTECNSPFERILTECPYCHTPFTPSGGGGGGGLAKDLTLVDGDLHLLDPEVILAMEAKSRLEDPAEVARRVSLAAGGKAGLIALRNQVDRIAMQKELINTIALWCGRQKTSGLTDRMMNKKFYLEYGKTMTQALSEPRAQMEQMKNELDSVTSGRYW